MDKKITTYATLSNLVDMDAKDHKLKDIATLFLQAINDWQTYNLTDIQDFIKEFKAYYGSPLTIEKIRQKKFDGHNAWQVEAGCSIAELIEISTIFLNQSDFDKIIDSVLNFYNDIFNKVDFIAELQYLTTEQGGRKTPACSGYRPQTKFDFDAMQTSGQQTFIEREMVFPGETVNAEIKIIAVEHFAHKLKEGMTFQFLEGSTLVGTGKIKLIINDKLKKASR